MADAGHRAGQLFLLRVRSAREMHPCISEEEGTLVEEIGFVIALGDGISAVCSLMRSNEGSPFSATEFQTLAEVGPIIFAAMRRHYGLRNGSENAPAVPPITESAFRLAFGEHRLLLRLSAFGRARPATRNETAPARGAVDLRGWRPARR